MDMARTIITRACLRGEQEGVSDCSWSLLSAPSSWFAGPTWLSSGTATFSPDGKLPLDVSGPVRSTRGAGVATWVCWPAGRARAPSAGSTACPPRSA
eukprot:4153996-Heterocapsa_arctica.AAC.1